MSDRAITLDPEDLFDGIEVTDTFGLTLTKTPYGWDIWDETGEWQLTIRMSAGQDGKIAAKIVLTSVDGGSDYRSIWSEFGLDTAEAIQRSIYDLTACWNQVLGVGIKGHE